MLDEFHRRWIYVAAVACGVGLLPVSLVAAQEPAQPAPTQAAPAPEPPQEITTADFALEANAVEERLSRIEAQISAIDVIADVNKALDEIETTGEGLHEEFKGIADRRAMTSELNTLEQRLEVQEARTDFQIGRLGKYADGLETLAIQNEQDVEIWRRAYRQTRRGSVPKAVRDRTGSILQGLQEGGSKLDRKQLEVLEVQTRALDVRDAIHQAQQAVTLAKRAQIENVFRRQDPPLWKWGSQADAAQGRAGYDVDFSWTAIVEYVRAHVESLIWQLVLFLVLGFALARARKLLNARVEKHKESGLPPWERRAVEALRHPWAAALLLTFASMRFIQPDRAVDFILVAWAAVIPLWYVVFREMVPRDLRKALLGIALLGALQILVALASDNSWIERALLLVELLSATAGFAWLVRFLRLVDAPKRVREGLWFSLLGLWARFALVVSVCGVLATIVGYTYLAMDAAMVAVIGTISATAWMALARIVEALVATGVHTGKFDASRMARANRDVLTRASSRAIRLLAAAMFLWSISDMTTIWRPASGPLKSLLAADLGFGFTELGLTVGDLVLFFVVLWVSWVIARFVSFVLREEIFPRMSVKEGVPYALTTFTRYAIIAIGFITAVSVLGVPLDRVTIILSALGVGIGFGLQKLVSNVVSGFVLLTERPIRLRDKVQIDEVLGSVSHIGMRASTVRTFDGAEVIIPNDDLISGRVVNFTLSARHQRVILPIGVAYGTDPAQVLGILRKLAAADDKVFTTPAPLALFRGFGDSSLDFELRVFMDPSDVLDVPSELYVAIDAALKEAGIEIPFPQRDLHVRSVADGITFTGTGTGSDAD